MIYEGSKGIAVGAVSSTRTSEGEGVTRQKTTVDDSKANLAITYGFAKQKHQIDLDVRCKLVLSRDIVDTPVLMEESHGLEVQVDYGCKNILYQ